MFISLRRFYLNIQSFNIRFIDYNKSSNGKNPRIIGGIKRNSNKKLEPLRKGGESADNRDPQLSTEWVSASVATCSGPGKARPRPQSIL